MKILVTGACGTIGLAVAEKFISANHEVIGYDRVGSDLPDGASLIEGDVRDFAHLTGAARGCEAGIHLAAVADGATVSDILSINALGAYGFLAAAREAGFKRTIIAGSAPVHLPSSDRDNSFPPPSDGDDRVYDLSKALQEVIANDFRSHGLAVLCLRFGHVVRGKRKPTWRARSRSKTSTIAAADGSRSKISLKLVSPVWRFNHLKMHLRFSTLSVRGERGNVSALPPPKTGSASLSNTTLPLTNRPELQSQSHRGRKAGELTMLG